MKHILKPVGHCLATAVMTSTLLRVYPASIAEAASPEAPLPNSNEEPHQNTEDSVSAEETARQTAVPIPAESSAAPEVSGTVSPSLPEAAPSTPPGQTSAAAAPAPQNSAAQGATPQAEQPTSGNLAGKSAAQKQPIVSQPQTLAAMRQQIDQRLAAIVERDRATREAQLQQNLVTIALRYAETGAFEPARQVARHPALSPDVQTALLTQIDQIAAAASAQAGDKAGDPVSIAAVPAPTTDSITAHGAAGTVEPGRVIPLHSGLSLPGSQSWTGTSVLPQCPADQSASTPAPARPIAQDKFQASRWGNQIAAGLAASVQPSPTSRPETKTQAAQATPLEPVTPLEQATRPEAAPTVKITPESRSIDPAPASPATQEQTVQATNNQFQPEAESRSQPVKPEPLRVSVDATQPGSSPLEVMGYWIRKPLKNAGIRLPFFLVLSDRLESENSAMAPAPEEQTIRSDALDGAIASSSDDPGPESAALTIADLMQDLASGSVQPALSLSPYLLELKQSVKDRQAPEKDAVKLSPAAAGLPPLQVQPVSQKTPAPQAAPLQAVDCFLPIAESTSVTISPAVSRQMGWRNFAFPLAIPAVLTSGFGWRIHPISGDRRFHAGIDLGAPMGTPVIAAAAGRVVAADDMGGYGLTVIVETPAGQYRNLYAHLSGIAVRPGTPVQQGSVLGWVGSTGSSTGPHLHFETLIPSAEGWMAIDPLSAAAEAIASRAGGE